MTTNFVPPGYYQEFISDVTGDGVTCTLTLTAATAFMTGMKGRIGNTGLANANTPTGDSTTLTKTGASTLTYPCAAVGSMAQGYVVWNPAPNAGDTYVDPVFGTTVRRVLNRELTSPSQYCPEDGGWQNFSPDETKLIFRENDQNQWELRNVVDGSVFRTKAQLNGCVGLQAQSNPRWKDDNTLFYRSGNTLYTCDLTTLLRTQLRAFTGCDANSLTVGNHGDLDDTRDQIALQCGKSTDATYDYWVYKISTDTEGPRYNITAGADFPFVVEQSTGGVLKDFIVNIGTDDSGGGGDPNKGVWLINGTTGAAIRQVVMVSGHSKPIRSGGVDWWVQEGGGVSSCPGGVISIDITGVVSPKCIINGANFGRGVYFGSTNSLGTNPGWIGISYGDTRGQTTNSAATPTNLCATWATPTTVNVCGWLRYHNEQVTCKYNSATAVWNCWRIAHSYHRYAGANDQVYGGKLSPNGKYMAWRFTVGAICFNASPACPVNSTQYKETAIAQIRT